MAQFEVAARAEQASILPGLLLVNYLERDGLLPPTGKTFHQGSSLPGSHLLQLTSAEGKVVSDREVVEYLAALARDKLAPTHVSSATEWVGRSFDLAGKDMQTLNKLLAELDAHLTLRTYLAGYQLSAADVVVWATIRGNPVATSLAKKVYTNVSRWYSFVEESNPWLPEAIKELTSQATAERAKAKAAASAAGASFDIDLPKVDGPIVTRFPPEPSGYLHIGHAKAALLNDYFAHLKPDGVLICRFDDTNPSKESMEFQDAIIEDLKMMDIIPDKTSFSSDSFQEMYDYAIQLIKDGKAFADDSELGKGDEDRKNRLPSKRRDLGIEETLSRFQEMKTGSEEGLRWCLRARIAYDSPNGTLRDPVIFRCNLTPHHRTGTQWKIYPTYDFCAPILDSIEGVTLALRTNEYRDRNAQYEWMQEALRLRKVPIWDFSRMNFVRTVLSKRKLTRIVDEGRVWGWDDPRMPTIRGVLRRGMTVPALREFILKQGPSRNVLNLEWGVFWAHNKKYVDPVAARHTAIVIQDAVYCNIPGLEKPEVLVKPKYLKNPDLGTKKVVTGNRIVIEQVDAQSFAEGEEITLMNWGNAFVRKIVKDAGGERVSELALELNPGGDVKKTKKITWLAKSDSNMVPVDLVSFDYLITKDKLEKTDIIEECLTPVTEWRSQAWADCNVADLAPGARIQFERKGYYQLDVSGQPGGSRKVFFEIPSGKS